MFHQTDAPLPADRPNPDPAQERLKWRQRLLLVIGLVCLTAAAYRVFDRWVRPAPTAPQPAAWEEVEPLVKAYLQEQIRRVQTDPRNWERHAILALAYAANGLWEPALAGFENASRLQPGQPLPLLYTAIALEFSGQIETALERYRDVCRQFPSFAPAFSRLGEAALRHGEPEESGQAFLRLIELEPEEWRGYAGLAEVRLRQNTLEEALALAQTAVDKAPGAGAAHHLLGLVYEQLGRPEEAKRERQLGLSPIRPPLPDDWATQAPLHMRRQQDLIALAQDLLQNGQPARAVTLLEPALPHDPNSLPLLTTLGLAHQQAGQPDQATTLLNRALDQDPGHVPALIALAATRLNQGNLPGARELARRAVQQAPELPQPHLLSANIALAENQDNEAIAALESAAATAPNSGWIHLDIANILFLNQGRPAEALKHYRQAIAIEPGLIPAHVRTAQILLQTGQTNEALAAIRTARQWAPTDTNLQAFEAAILSPPHPPDSTPQTPPGSGTPP